MYSGYGFLSQGPSICGEDGSLDFPVCRPQAFSCRTLITFSAKALSPQDCQKTKMFRYLLGFMIFGLEVSFFLLLCHSFFFFFFLFNVFYYTLKFSALLFKTQAFIAPGFLSVTKHTSVPPRGFQGLPVSAAVAGLGLHPLLKRPVCSLSPPRVVSCAFLP